MEHLNGTARILLLCYLIRDLMVLQQISACNHHTLFVLAWRIPSCVSGNNLKQTFFQGRQDVYLTDNSLLFAVII